MTTTSSDPSANNKRVIVVEDNRDFRESMVEYLVLAGLNVTGVESALEFYKSISLQTYLLVILDIGLPDQNGLVLAEYVRNNTDMRIVMLTAQSSLESKISAYQSGADIYLVKPIDFSELSASIHSMLGRLEEQHSSRQEINKAESALEKGQNQWQLVTSGWTLCSPKGEEIKLTSKEFDLIYQLALVHNSIALRQDILKALDYENNDFGNRALDALIHRLRRKNESLNSRIPIKTIHGSGYSFSSPIIIV